MGIPRSRNVLTKQERIAMLAKQSPAMCFTSLNHHIDLDWLREAFRQTRKDGAVGVDGQTWAEYEVGLDSNLASLLTRAKSGSYFAPPVRRAYIPKGNGETRPIGIPCLEDKVLQRAVVMLLEPIYEQDFLDCSYGFRPKRSQHMAISALWNQIGSIGGGRVLEIDIRKFFDTLDKAKLRELIEQRVGDGVIKRLIGKWLNAGVMESGSITFPESGSPQGGVISPLVSNVYLHYVLDQWFEMVVKPILRGRASMVRFADDAVLVFTDETDARSVMAALHKRFEKYGLRLHPDKTRILQFCRPSVRLPEPITKRKSETFDFLGFTHYWGESRYGRPVLKRKTAKDRQARAIKKITEWCRKHRHFSLPEQHKELGSKLRGHYQYYGVTGNMRCLQKFQWATTIIWKKWLGRRSQRGQMSWTKFECLIKRYPLPKAWIPHSVYIT
jgi:RNA-directed DNA polymerase